MALRSPCLIVEVLSESTARIDRREKLLAYQSLPSLQAYLLVEQEARRRGIARAIPSAPTAPIAQRNHPSSTR